VTIHDDHPFLPDEGDRDPVRRFRGRLAAAVTLWTAGRGPHGRAGLTVSSLMVAAGEPARVLALLDPESDLCARLEETRTAVVHQLAWRHRGLADAFAGTAPAPGGPFRAGEFEQLEAGPQLVDAPAWASVSLEDAADLGWSRLVTCVIDEARVGPDDDVLLHRRGRYLRLD
jgi:flavin reductase (DIM6/NTAB) family NADH-FMN oxidoreductase RutF